MVSGSEREEVEEERYFYLAVTSDQLTLSIMSCTSQGITDTSADWRRTMKVKHRQARKRKVVGRGWCPSTFLIL